VDAGACREYCINESVSIGRKFISIIRAAIRDTDF